MKYKRHKRLIYFASISILLSLISYHFVSKDIYPYELVEESYVPVNRQDETYLIEDLDEDGFSEQILITNNTEKAVFYVLIIDPSEKITRTEKVLSQYNFSTPFLKNSWYFLDITHDGKKELIIFNQATDTLYLSIIDVYSEGWIINQQPVMFAENPLNYHTWDITHVYCERLENVFKNYDDIMIGIQTGYALKPRGLFLFDVSKKTITKRFPTRSSVTGLLKFDLTNDGEDDFILSGRATGNFPPDLPDGDHNCWVYILDRNLDLKFPPLKFGEFPSILHCNPVYVKDKKYLFVSYNYVGRKSHPNSLYLINSESNIELKKDIHGHIYDAIVYEELNISKIFLSMVGGRLFEMSPTFQIINEKEYPHKLKYVLDVIDLNGDSKEELISVSTRGIYIFDENLNQTAIYEKSSLPIFFKYRGVNNPVDIVSKSLKTQSYYQLEYNRNLIYSLLPALFTGIAALIFISFMGLERFNALINIYLAFFFYYMQKSKNAIIILNKNGKIKHFNRHEKILRDLAAPLTKGESYSKVFSGDELVLSGIRQVFEKGEIIKLKRNKKLESTGEILLLPFKDIFNSVIGILIEFADASESSPSDRLKIWSIAMQKIAHEIKTPLSTIALNLRALQMRLEKSNIEDRAEYKNDIQLIHGEVERLTALTKNFLKFSNLEKLNIQLYDVSQIIKNSLQSFSTYFNHNLQVSLNFDPKAKKIYADSKQLEMVLHILIENAIDAMKGEGLISISTVLAEDILKNGTKYIEIEIADMGPGIEEDMKEKIFNPQFSTKFNGTGMGLAIAKKVIEDHRGTIEVHTRENFGTVFRITLPFQK